MHQVQFRVISLEAPVAVELQLVVLVQQYFQRRPHGDVRAHRSVERKQGVGTRNVQAGGTELDATDEDRAAIFDFANLQIWRILRRAQWVSLGVYQEKVWLLSFDLAA